MCLSWLNISIGRMGVSFLHVAGPRLSRLLPEQICVWQPWQAGRRLLSFVDEQAVVSRMNVLAHLAQTAPCACAAVLGIHLQGVMGRRLAALLKHEPSLVLRIKKANSACSTRLQLWDRSWGPVAVDSCHSGCSLPTVTSQNLLASSREWTESGRSDDGS